MNRITSLKTLMVAVGGLILLGFGPRAWGLPPPAMMRPLIHPMTPGAHPGAFAIRPVPPPRMMPHGGPFGPVAFPRQAPTVAQLRSGTSLSSQASAGGSRQHHMAAYRVHAVSPSVPRYFAGVTAMGFWGYPRYGSGYNPYGQSSYRYDYSGYGGSGSSGYSAGYGGTGSAAMSTASPAPAESGDGTASQTESVSINLLAAFGLPNENGRLLWPLGLRVLAPAAETDPLRAQVDALAVLIAGQATQYGRADAALVHELNRAVDRLETRLAARSADFAEATAAEARRFLQNLRHTAKVAEAR